ncbi:dynein heavy chain 3, axonemal-like, partial [Protobothrops mucrosquamatus]|uniref:dynein heavy chain 3, axonemal-like n=1 Tax=Protobothrops mucrosquamatus TaxID=103944 RepID=UPI0007756A46
MVEEGAPRYSDSQPLTPEQQFVVMHQHEEEISKGQQAPTEEDLERYCYYIHKGIRKDMLALQDENVLNNILTHIPSIFLASPDLEGLLNSLMEEIQSDYQIWLMKNIVDYILMDPQEKKRLFIRNVPQPFPQRVIRAPVPWHKIYQETKIWNETHLFTVNPMMFALQQLWFTEFTDLRFVRTKEILQGDLPLLPSEFEELIQRQCQEAHEILQTRWIPRCAELFVEQKEKWLHLAPQNDLDSSQQIEEYFASVAILMSLQLREMVINSLEDLLDFFKIHKDGNDFGEVYQDMQFFIPQILVLKLDVEDPSIIFDPDVQTLWDLVYRCFLEILKHSESLPKVQVKLFPELKGEDLILRTVNKDETLVASYVQKTAEIFHLNLIGPQKYLNVYRKYNDLLNNNADKEVTEFLSKRHDLEDFVEKIDGLTKLKKEIGSLHVTVPLALFCLDALKLNEELCTRTQRLKDRLIEFEVEENRNLNKSICNQYNIIADKVSEVPLTTEQLVELTAYLKKSSEVTVFKLRREIREAIYRLEFLMDYADLPRPVLQLNAEEITEDVANMWRTMYKLTKTFIDLPGPKRMAENVKYKIDKFKQHLPVLSIACNHGMKDRHWEQISEIVGYEIRPDETTSLMNMLEYGLSKYIDKIEPIGAAASKEYSLEKNMEKMKSEWVNIRFTFVKYRDTDTSILSAIDDIQLLLDDHIIKTQTMCGSPFIKPIEAECRVKDTRVLIATEQPKMLNRLQEANMFLEDIQKGLNNYLEKKRLFFPRFFFLSNDELLEILSETKDPLRGMVEKWLLQVEEMMLASIRQVMENGIKGYDEAFLEKSNKQIGEIVELVRGKLSSGARLTLGALTVIDVH